MNEEHSTKGNVSEIDGQLEQGEGGQERASVVRIVSMPGTPMLAAGFGREDAEQRRRMLAQMRRAIKLLNVLARGRALERRLDELRCLSAPRSRHPKPPERGRLHRGLRRKHDIAQRGPGYGWRHPRPARKKPWPH